METKRIIAHYMPETEQGEDLRQLSSLQDSCACVIRDADDAHIPAPKAAGPIVEESADVPTLRATVWDSLFLSIQPRRPLVETWHARLERCSVRLVGSNACGAL